MTTGAQATRASAAVAVFPLALALALVHAGTGLARGGPGPPPPASEEAITSYYDSGAYAEDVAVVARRARRYLRRQVRRHGERRDHAMVLDIDDTALSSYECQRRQGGFGSTELTACVVEAALATTTGSGDGLPAIDPVRRLYRLAQRRSVKVFFITGRPALATRYSIENLRAQGFAGPFELTTQTDAEFLDNTLNHKSLVPYKSAERAAIERRGYRILVNVGDQRSDLQGGHAKRSYKLPNPMYLTP